VERFVGEVRVRRVWCVCWEEVRRGGEEGGEEGRREERRGERTFTRVERERPTAPGAEMST
jgi:hypothetical protein